MRDIWTPIAIIAVSMLGIVLFGIGIVSRWS